MTILKGQSEGHKMAKDKGFCIDNYDEVSACEQGYEFEALLPDGAKTGVFITVRGSESSVIQDAVSKKINKERSKAFMAEKSGKVQAPTQFEDDINEGLELTVMRIISWRGFVDKAGVEVPFSKDEGYRVLNRFRSLAKQITENSSELTNFIKG